MIQIVRAESHREMPWKNGGGVTTEIAIYPPGASLDAFEWRVSLATMAGAGPFSAFPGVDRLLGVLDGRGVRLQIGGGPPVTVIRGSEPLLFGGDLPVEARTVDGIVTILNIMVRRGRCRASLDRHIASEIQELPLSAPISLVLCRDGQVTLSQDEWRETLANDDVAVSFRSSDAGASVMQVQGRASLYRVGLWPGG